MKFIVDGMLGGLARWLRILGQTVSYDSSRSDSTLLDLASSEEVVLLTGDRELYRRALTRNIRSVLIIAKTEEERLAQVGRQLGIPLLMDMNHTSCPECGGALGLTPKHSMEELVPAESFRLYDEFWRCTQPGCGKVYWKGSHWKQMEETLRKMRRIAELEAERGIINISEGTLLVHTARNAIEYILTSRRFKLARNISMGLQKERGVFVTLTDAASGALKGCIGDPFPKKQLLKLTAETAISAATLDPRFEPITRDELSRVLVEVSVLSTPKKVNATRPVDLSQWIVVGSHGLIAESRGAKGVLLPQVAVDERFDSEEFLSQTCLKAGLAPDAWLTGEAGISTFEAQVFSEDKPNGQVAERELTRPSKVR